MRVRAENLDVRYGAITAVRGAGFQFGDGEIVSILGANGAGKSTVLKCLAGLKVASQGAVYFDEQNVTKWSARRRVASGVVMVPEGRQLFPTLTVFENLILGAIVRLGPFVTRRHRDDLDVVFQLFPVLSTRLSQQAQLLSGGEQQMLAIGRALMARPQVLLLDEPSLGLSPKLKALVIMKLRQLQTDARCTIILVEQDASLALKVSDRAYVLQQGTVVLEGRSDDLVDNEELVKAYLGYV